MEGDAHQLQADAARNQSLFREVNERIEQLQRGWRPVSEVDFVCECANASCSAPVSLTVEEYERVRAEPGRFVVLHDHVLPEVEWVVARTERYWVLEKIEHAKRIAVALDPRRNHASAGAT